MSTMFCPIKPQGTDVAAHFSTFYIMSFNETSLKQSCRLTLNDKHIEFSHKFPHSRPLVTCLFRCVLIRSSHAESQPPQSLKSDKHLPVHVSHLFLSLFCPSPEPHNVSWRGYPSMLVACCTSLERLITP